MVEIRRNVEKDGIEIVFPERPAETILTWLKANHYRWSRYAKAWYKKYDEYNWNLVTEYFGIASGSEISNDQLAIGTQIEKEHTNDPEEAEKIAMDHLKENPKYYSEAKPKDWGIKELQDENRPDFLKQHIIVASVPKDDESDVPKGIKKDIEYLLGLQKSKHEGKGTGGMNIDLFKSSLYGKLKTLHKNAEQKKVNAILGYLKKMNTELDIPEVFTSKHGIWKLMSEATKEKPGFFRETSIYEPPKGKPRGKSINDLELEEKLKNYTPNLSDAEYIAQVLKRTGTNNYYEACLELYNHKAGNHGDYPLQRGDLVGEQFILNMMKYYIETAWDGTVTKEVQKFDFDHPGFESPTPQLLLAPKPPKSKIVSPQTIEEAVQCLKGLVAKDDRRPAMKYVYRDETGLVASDSYVLVHIPTELGKEDTLYDSKSGSIFSGMKTYLQGTYPKYKSVIPQSFVHSSGELSLEKLLGIFAPYANTRKIIIPRIDNAIASFVRVVIGDRTRWYDSYKLFQVADALYCHGTKVVTLNYPEGAAHPMIFKDVNDPERLGLVMPLDVRDEYNSSSFFVDLSVEMTSVPIVDTDKTETERVTDEVNEMFEGAKTAEVEKIFPDPGKTVIAEKIAREKGEKLTIEQGRARIQAWKDYAKKIRGAEDHSKEVILSIYDRTGVWPDPFAQAGYTVVKYDISNGDDMFADSPISIIEAIEDAFPGSKIVGILSAPPCTSFAGSGAWAWDTHDTDNNAKVEKLYGRQAARLTDKPVEAAAMLVGIIDVIIEQARIKGHPISFYTLENPVGRIAEIAELPKPTLTFQPNVYGDPYTKKTQIWGEFNTDLPQAYVEATEGSKITEKYGSKDRDKRSATPEGFAYAFFMANNTSSIKFEPSDILLGNEPEYFTAENAPDNIKDRFGVAKDGYLEKRAGIPKTFIKDLPGGEKLYSVDGKYARDYLYSDFSQGGNDMAYPEFVPIGELWYESAMEAEKEHIINHEKRERDLMVNAGYTEEHPTEALSYSEAHEIVKNIEDSERGTNALAMDPKTYTLPELREIYSFKNGFNLSDLELDNFAAGTVTRYESVGKLRGTYPDYEREPVHKGFIIDSDYKWFVEVAAGEYKETANPYKHSPGDENKSDFRKGDIIVYKKEFRDPGETESFRYELMEDPDGGRVLLKAIDTGMGIAPTEVAQLSQIEKAPAPIKSQIIDVFLPKIKIIKPFLSQQQLDYLTRLYRSEEKEAAIQYATQIAAVIEAMQKSYETDDIKTPDKIIHLHYFLGDSDWYIVEKDKGQSRKEEKEAGLVYGRQYEAYGYAILNGDYEMAEWGYVNIQELIENNVELDFHWTPKTFSEVKKKWTPEEPAKPVIIEDVESFNDITEKTILMDEIESLEKNIRNGEKLMENPHFTGDVRPDIEIDKHKVEQKKKLLFDKFGAVYGPKAPVIETKKTISVPESSVSVTAADYKNEFELNKAIEALLTKKWYIDSWSEQELEFIKGYSGYGGLDKFGEITKGSLFEYFTPEKVIEKMWGLAYKYGYKDGPVLEPSCGIGPFFDRRFVSNLIEKHGYEINKYSAKIAKLLYPEAIINDGGEVKYFEQLFIVKNYTVRAKVTPKYQLVIGNPPYGAVGGIYMGMGEKSYTHANNYIDYFILRGLDLLLPGGLLIYIIGAETAGGGVPFLDQGMNKVKEMILERGKLIDAYRLPSGVFSRTDVTSDIVVFRKR